MRARAAACVLSGALYFLAVTPFDLWPLAWFALVPLLWALEGQRPRRAFFLGWLMGFTMNTGGFYWMWSTVGRLGGLPEPLAFLTFVVIMAYQGLLYGLLGAAYARVQRGPFALPVLLVALEKVYWMPFSFGFYISQAWQIPVIQVAELGGPHAVTFLLALSSAALYRRRPLGLLVTAGVLLAALGFGHWRGQAVLAARAAAPKLRVGLAQGNLPLRSFYQGILVAPTSLKTLQRVSAELEAQGAELVIWSENEHPYLFDERQTRDFPQPEMALLRGFRGPVLAGIRSALASGGRVTSAILIQPDGTIAARYDKQVLVPFGEYIPLAPAAMVPENMRGVAGRALTVIPFGTARLGVLICLEDILPDCCRRVAQLQPSCLINLTNDAWFGVGAEPYQHLALSVFRSVECRLDLVRCTKNGASAFIDSTGRITQRGPVVDPYEGTRRPPPTPLLGDVALQPPTGLYVRWGPVFSWLMVLLSAWWLVAGDLVDRLTVRV